MARLIIDLLRHGRCDDGAIYRGRTDSPLSSSGLAQMESAIAAMVESSSQAGPGWQQILCSPLQRCSVPAASFARQLQLPLVVEPDLRELDFGQWEGLPLEQVWQQQLQQVMAFWQDPDRNPPPDGESLQALRQRLQALMQGWLAKVEEGSERRLLCVTHGGVVRAIICMLLGLPGASAQQLSLDYASLSRVELYPDNEGLSEHGYHAQLIFFNRRALLSDYD
ncbi:histidine phosphatase family protein [Motiliproteus coralliicola]|uniref:Histidine phosphatase family protein n=1 Tax=Motiliproteus coralliicola TaxID=2283196 RepID=A0A369WT26_9GAMM|nr:histidine phosphatase family protein [Motiliproteus coralliicola]RDE22645.1 histidine phosphatase family protein [Motiliproteus coralliicola]